MRRSSPVVLLALLVGLAGPAAAQDARWKAELPDAYGIDFLAPLPPFPSHLLSPWPTPPAARKPADVRALYVNAWAFGGSRFRELVRLADETEINALVIDLKDDTGYLTYRLEGADRPRHRRHTATPRPGHRGPGPRNAGARHLPDRPDRGGQGSAARGAQARVGHSEPRTAASGGTGAAPPGWTHSTIRCGCTPPQLAAEAVQMGFAEVQFDYVRFPDEPRARMASAVFPARRAGESTRQGVHRNLLLVRDRMRTLGVPFTIDVFGMTTVHDGRHGDRAGVGRPGELVRRRAADGLSEPLCAGACTAWRRPTPSRT